MDLRKYGRRRAAHGKEVAERCFFRGKDYGNTITKIGRRNKKTRLQKKENKKKGKCSLKTESWLPRWSEESQIILNTSSEKYLSVP